MQVELGLLGGKAAYRVFHPINVEQRLWHKQPRRPTSFVAVTIGAAEATGRILWAVGYYFDTHGAVGRVGGHGRNRGVGVVIGETRRLNVFHILGQDGVFGRLIIPT